MKNSYSASKYRLFFPLTISFCVILLFYIKRFVLLKYYPPICNFVLLAIFTISIFGKKTIIQKFAELFEGKELTPKQVLYTRVVNLVWSVFMLLNFLISVWTIFLSDKIWIIYNGLVSYILVGIVFGVEYLIRILLKRRNLL